MKLFFGGDVCVSGSFAEAHAAQRSLIGPHIRMRMQEADRVILNLEGALLPPGVSPEKHPIHNPPSLLPESREWGKVAFTLANNHMLDAGKEAISFTCDQLDAHQVNWTGIGTQGNLKPIVIAREDISVAVVAMSFGTGEEEWQVTHPPSDSAMRRTIARLKEQHEHVILTYHGEEEYTCQPWPKRRTQLLRWARMGVSAIICHHPHVPQGWEVVANVPVFYSLGNFLFDRPHHHKWDHTGTGLAVMLDLGKETLAFQPLALMLDREKGQVDLDEKAVLPQLDLSAKAWRAECYRVLFQGHVAYDTRTETSLKGGEAQKARRSSMLSRFFRPTFYQTILAYLRHANTRVILFGAILHKLTSR